MMQVLILECTLDTTNADESAAISVGQIIQQLDTDTHQM
jgi:hypothetical protein